MHELLLQHAKQHQIERICHIDLYYILICSIPRKSFFLSDLPRGKKHKPGAFAGIGQTTWARVYQISQVLWGLHPA